MGVVIKRFDVYLIKLGPTIGSEINKTRAEVLSVHAEMFAS